MKKFSWVSSLLVVTMLAGCGTSNTTDDAAEDTSSTEETTEEVAETEETTSEETSE